jgi:hypothetical protein
MAAPLLYLSVSKLIKDQLRISLLEVSFEALINYTY